MEQAVNVLDEAPVQQTVLTKFFQSSSGSNFTYLFEKEEADRKARILREKQLLKEQAKAEKRALREQEQREQRERQEARERERAQRVRESSAKFEGVEIVPGVYLGARLAAQNYDWLKEVNITHVVNASIETTNYFEHDSNFRYLRVPILTLLKVHDAVEEDISSHFERIAAFIDEARNVEANVLVHCREGKSRSVSSVIAYLMLKLNKSLKEAHDHVLGLTPWTTNINLGFQQQLMKLDLKLAGVDAELSMEFINKAGRLAKSNRPNYCELEAKKGRRRKKVEPVQKTTLFSLETYWKLIQEEKGEVGKKVTLVRGKLMLEEKVAGSVTIVPSDHDGEKEEVKPLHEKMFGHTETAIDNQNFEEKEQTIESEAGDSMGTELQVTVPPKAQQQEGAREKEEAHEDVGMEEKEEGEGEAAEVEHDDQESHENCSPQTAPSMQAVEVHVERTNGVMSSEISVDVEMMDAPSAVEASQDDKDPSMPPSTPSEVSSLSSTNSSASSSPNSLKRSRPTAKKVDKPRKKAKSAQATPQNSILSYFQRSNST